MTDQQQILSDRAYWQEFASKIGWDLEAWKGQEYALLLAPPHAEPRMRKVSRWARDEFMATLSALSGPRTHGILRGVAL